MITRCPSCETAFRVHRHQLDARDGRVRCGRCAVVFDARLSLTPDAEEPGDAAIPRASDRPAQAPAEPLPEPTRTRIDEPPSAPFSRPAADEPIRGARGAPTLPPTGRDAEISYAESEEDYDFGPHRRRRSRIGAALWSVGGLALALLLALQAIFHFRSDIAGHVPEVRGWLGRACEALGCEVPLPSHASLVTIEASEMQPDASAQGVIALSAVLRNRAPFVQQQPWLELTLTDAQDRAIARRVLAPRDYLGPRAEFEQAFPAGAEQSLRLLLDVDTLPARGYRLLVFYP